MDIGTINAAFGAAKSIKELGKGLLDAKIDAAVKDRFREMLEKIGNFQEALYLLREELLTQQQEKTDLKAKVDELQAKLDQKSKVEFIMPSYWIVDEGEKDGPYCQRCYDVDERLVRLQVKEGDDYWRCSGCSKIYQKPGATMSQYKPPRRLRRS